MLAVIVTRKRKFWGLVGFGIQGRSKEKGFLELINIILDKTHTEFYPRLTRHISYSLWLERSQTVPVFEPLSMGGIPEERSTYTQFTPSLCFIIVPFSNTCNEDFPGWGE